MKNISTSRANSKKLDDMKIDIFDEDNILPCYFQLKKLKLLPQLKELTLKLEKKINL